eukprot:scaffold4402_cov25-Tisochrysis_lutea.AAC.3
MLRGAVVECTEECMQRHWHWYWHALALVLALALACTGTGTGTGRSPRGMHRGGLCAGEGQPGHSPKLMAAGSSSQTLCTGHQKEGEHTFSSRSGAHQLGKEKKSLRRPQAACIKERCRLGHHVHHSTLMHSPAAALLPTFYDRGLAH